MTLTNSLSAACAAAFGLLPVACAQQPEPAAMSGLGRMSGVSTHDMARMGMPTMMNQCAQMRKDVSQGKQLVPGMQNMMVECDEMDRSMTKIVPASAPAPAATLSR